MNMLTNKSTHLTGQFGQGRQKGNTLVPVLIALAIALAATAAFLLQGEDLIDDNKKLMATTEVASLLSEYNAIRATGVAANAVTQAQVPGIAGNNVYNLNIGFVAFAAAGAGGGGGAVTSITYGTDGAESCQYLAAAFNGSEGVAATACAAAGGGNNNLTITLN